MAPPNAPKLPARLLQELSGTETTPKTGRFQPREGRKELRKAHRAQRKLLRNGPPPQKRLKTGHKGLFRQDQADHDQPPKRTNGHPENGMAPPTSILMPKKQEKSHNPTGHEQKALTETPRLSRGIRDKLAQDDEEIALLEKRLGLRGRKSVPKFLKDDGIDDLLDGLDWNEDDKEIKCGARKNEGAEWLLEKRRKQARKIALGDDLSSEEGDDGDSTATSFDEENSGLLARMSDKDDHELSANEEDDFEGLSSEIAKVEGSPHAERIRENPYVAPSTNSVTAPERYIPPSLRMEAPNSDALIRLRRQVQGLVNKLTEANLISILGDVEKLYRENPRQNVTSMLMDMLLTSVCEPATLPDTLIILPAGFIAAIYKVIGADCGAQIIQGIVESFDQQYMRIAAAPSKNSTAATDTSKETSNLIMLLSELCNFQVIGSALLFDYIKLLLSDLSELNTELLLKIIRTSGPQLRQDDPSSLKDMVSHLRVSVNRVGEQNLSIRTKFMIEVIDGLKNGKMKVGTLASGIASEHTIRMKKILGSLNTRTVKSSEPLRFGLKDIRNSDKRGKWWIVGASWAGSTVKSASDAVQEELRYNNSVPVEDAGTSDLGQLARENRMNTDIRRAIFVAIMSASDYQDAYMRLLKLKLKKVQEFEIPKVLIHCACAEKSYNPYYTLIAKKVCGDKRLRTSFQYCLWDIFKKLGESDDEEDLDTEDVNDNLDTRQLVKLSKMFGSLVAENALSITVLKNLNLSYLQPKTRMFMEVLMVTLLLYVNNQPGDQNNETALADVFLQAKDTPQLARGLMRFLNKVVYKTDIVGKTQKDAIRWASKVAVDILRASLVPDIREQ